MMSTVDMIVMFHTYPARSIFWVYNNRIISRYDTNNCKPGKQVADKWGYRSQTGTVIAKTREVVGLKR